MKNFDTQFSKWYSKQSKEFIDEISNGEITERFIDRNIRAITIEELEYLDNLHICDVQTNPEGNK